MGSFTSAPKIPNEDSGDEDVEFPCSMTWQDLKELCKEKLAAFPETLPRTLVDMGWFGKERIRIMQWNILGQGKKKIYIIIFLIIFSFEYKYCI